MRKGYQEVLSEAEYNTIYELAKKNEAFRQSLLNLGYGRYGVDTTGKYPKAGTFFLRPRLEFTKGMLGRTEDDLYYNQLKRALESNVVNFTKLNTTDRQNLSTSPHADQELNKIPDKVTDEQALFVGDILATGFWAARISEITQEDTVLIIGAGPTGVCTLLCVMLKAPKRIIICEKDSARRAFIQTHYPDVLVCEPEDCKAFVRTHSDHGGADVVLEVAGAKNTFELAWRLRPPQRHRDGRRLLRRAANDSPAGNVWEKPDLQDRRRGRLRLRRNSAADCAGQN